MDDILCTMQKNDYFCTYIINIINMRILFFLLLTACVLTGKAQRMQPADADAKYATELVKVGDAAPDFTLKTPEGKKVKLSKTTQGKWVLLDFWASWCPDCRKDIPNVKRMYHDFAPKGVQFIGVSFDTNVEAWQHAITKYDLTWTQVSELQKMRESAVAQAYGVKWIPSMVLIDPEGKVALATVLADKMEKRLTEIFAPKGQQAIGNKQAVTIAGSKGNLSAVIQKPLLAAGEQCPMVILCHGFGGDKKWQVFDLIADSLCQQGIASIRFDFNGHGESEGAFVDMTVPNEIEDAVKVFHYVRQLKEVSRVAIVGHSQGGVVASMTAGELAAGDIAAVALMAPAAVLRDDAIRGNTMGKSYNPLDPPEYVSIGNLKLGRAYIKSAFRLPIYETAAKYTGPALVVHGTGDRIVPYTYGIRYHQLWQGSEYVELEAFDHGFSQNPYRAARIVSDYLVKVLKP